MTMSYPSNTSKSVPSRVLMSLHNQFLVLLEHWLSHVPPGSVCNTHMNFRYTSNPLSGAAVYASLRESFKNLELERYSPKIHFYA